MFCLRCRFTPMPRAPSPPAPRARRGRPPANAPRLDLPRIIAAGEAVLQEQGWAGLSMRAVAARLAVDPMALYRHVASREALVAAMAADRCRALDADRLRFRAGTSWPQRLQRVARVYLGCVRGAPELIRALTASNEAAAALTKRWRAVISDLLVETGASPALVRQVADTVADLVHGTALAGDGSHAGSLHRSLELVIAGIEAVTSSQSSRA